MTDRETVTADQLRTGFRATYGDLGDTLLIGALYGRVTEAQRETIYREVCDDLYRKVTGREDSGR